MNDAIDDCLFRSHLDKNNISSDLFVEILKFVFFTISRIKKTMRAFV